MENLAYAADANVIFDGKGFEPDVSQFQFDGTRWIKMEE